MLRASIVVYFAFNYVLRLAVCSIKDIPELICMLHLGGFTWVVQIGRLQPMRF